MYMSMYHMQAVVLEPRSKLWVPWDVKLQMGVRHHVATEYQIHTLWKKQKMFLSTWCIATGWMAQSSQATTETHILNLGLAHSNIFPICDLLKCVKGLVLQNNDCRIHIAWGNSRIPRRSDNSECPLIIVCQRPWTTPMMTHCNEHLWFGLIGQKRYTVW